MSYKFGLVLFFLLNKTGPLISQTINSWDFIVIGAGSAGSIVAERLSANPSVRVLLIEAGGDSLQFLQDVPLAAVKLQNNLDYNWNYTAEREPNTCLAMEAQRCNYPRGKGLGGSSQINAMMYVRGNPLDYDGWASEGCTGWDYASVLPYFKRSESFVSSGQSGMIDYNAHGFQGPMTTEFPLYRTEYSAVFVQGALSIGMPHVDYNSVRQLGVSYLLSNTFKGRREDAGTEFITKMALNRPNFQVSFKSHVTKIIFDGNRATSVLFKKGDVIYRAPINEIGEIILSAGVINSPKLLMLSGIGPRETLKAHKIPLIMDLPVGKFMDDHPSILAPTYTTKYHDKAIKFLQQFDPTVFASWSKYGGTQLSIPFSVEGLAFGRCEDSEQQPGVPDFELMFLPTSYATDFGLYQRKNHRLTNTFYNQVYGQLQSMPNDTISVIVMMLHPKSNGSVTIRDTNPFSKPLIYPNTFVYKSDKKVLLCGIRLAQKIMTSNPFAKYNPKHYNLKIPGCSKFVADSDEHWSCALDYLATSMYHMVGTCRMGDKKDPTAVVTPDLKVIGIEQLRVVDSSVMRNVNSGHTAAPTMMIAEKVVDMIKQDHKKLFGLI